jgi:ribosome-associated heat shock protein Hsp15
MPERDPLPLDRLRIDVWLWRARIAKTRALAAQLVRSGHVRANGQRVSAPGRAVRVGDVLTVALERTVRVIAIAGFGERRGPASEARMLYAELSPDGTGANPPAGSQT